MVAGETGHALKLLRDTWGHMAKSVPGTMWEKMAVDGRPEANTAPGLGLPTSRPEGEGFSSLAHAWSTGPVQALSEYVLGLRARSPGYGRWIIAPQLGDLRWAQGQVGTPHGPLVSRWQRGSRSFRLTVDGPACTRGDVVVPLLGKARVIAMDGQVVWSRPKTPGGTTAVRQGDSVRFTNVTGRHTFALQD